MRLTRDMLIKIARDTAEQRSRVSRRIICIYLTGSVLGNAPLLGNTADIDLVIVEDSEPLEPREIVRLTDEVHLDISHVPQSMYHHPRRLRTDPWMGPFLYAKPMVLYDTQHWFDFAQAATGAQFFQPEYVLARAAALARRARDGWMALQMDEGPAHPQRVVAYLQAIENAGNALVSLGSEPLAERRFFVQLPQRLQALNLAEQTAQFIHLITPETADWQSAWPSWLPAWRSDYQAASTPAGAPPRLHPARLLYYERGAAALWEENPVAALWLLMRTWSLANTVAAEAGRESAQWNAALDMLGLGAADFDHRLAALDHTLDQVEEALDTWANANGVAGAGGEGF